MAKWEAAVDFDWFIYISDEGFAGNSAEKLLPSNASSSENTRRRVPINLGGHRLHRSSVRPFFCCGSQLSLNSISDFIQTSDQSDCDDGSDLMANLSLSKKTQNRRKKPNEGRKKFWTLKLRGKLHVPKRSNYNTNENDSTGSIVCTSFRKSSDESESGIEQTSAGASAQPQEVFVTLRPINFDELYPTEDIDQRRIQQRAREMEEGIDVQNACILIPQSADSSSDEEYDCPQPLTQRNSFSSFAETWQYGSFSMLPTHSSILSPSVRPHSQVDYIHCLVPDIVSITNCSYYWGVMDRYQAEKLLDKKPEGTFLLRDSAQEEYLFSVSFRRYGRSLHARIEQWNHKFSFDSHDPGVFASETVCGLIEHYKDASVCMFFEPLLTTPLHRTDPFSLQHMCRSIICDRITYDDINVLPLPRQLRDYMRYYHYRQKIRTRRYDMA